MRRRITNREADASIRLLRVEIAAIVAVTLIEIAGIVHA